MKCDEVFSRAATEFSSFQRKNFHHNHSLGFQQVSKRDSKLREKFCPALCTGCENAGKLSPLTKWRVWKEKRNEWSSPAVKWGFLACLFSSVFALLKCNFTRNVPKMYWFFFLFWIFFIIVTSKLLKHSLASVPNNVRFSPKWLIL